MSEHLPDVELNWMPFDAGVKFLSDRLMVNEATWVLKHWKCKYVDVRVDMRTGAMLIRPGNERLESCQCDSHEWRPDYVEIRDSRGGLHYADKPCVPPPTSVTVPGSGVTVQHNSEVADEIAAAVHAETTGGASK